MPFPFAQSRLQHLNAYRTPSAAVPPARGASGTGGSSMDATWMQSLNEQQRSAATAGASPLLIIEDAGTGKTNTVAHRVAHLIAEGTVPSRILLLTFTRRASAEMLKRVDNVLCSRGGAR